MDINFHYFAIKLLALEAGFKEEHAQKIAEYSQFIDDYNLTSKFKVTAKPPEWAINIGIAKEDQGIYEVDSIPTGFSIISNNTDILKLDFQKKVLVPFHFMPPRKCDNDYSMLCVVPSKLNDGQIISNLLNEVYNSFKQNKHTLTDDILIKIGCLAHVFSDTYAHQGFSGINEVDNDYEIESCERLGDQVFVDCTKAERSHFSSFPAIGHTTVGHVVDYTNAKFTIINKKNPKKVFIQKRNNSEYFIEPLQQLFTYFCQYTRSSAKFAPLVYKFKQGFKTSNLNPKELPLMWKIASKESESEVCSELFEPSDFTIKNFSYDYNETLLRLKQEVKDKKGVFTVTDEYFLFTAFAKQIIDSVFS